MHAKNIPDQAWNVSRFMWGSFVPGAETAGLNRSLGWRGLNIEGFLSACQATFFRQLLSHNPAITRILEIGFNAGHSSYVFLDARPDISVVSFDLGEHSYVSKAKAFLDSRYPGRHKLILGDSREAVPQYGAEHPGETFDLVFIDGGHDYEVAAADLLNSRAVAGPSTFLVIDDLQPWKTWGIGPAHAWSEARQAGLIEELRLMQDGEEVRVAERKLITTVWALGRYLFPAADGQT